MSDSASLTPRQAEVLEAILPGIERGLRAYAAARDAGLPYHCIVHVLGTVFGTASWPPDPAAVRAALARPRALRPQGRDYSGQSAPDSHRGLSDSEIWRRRDEAQAARAAHEARWLAEERRRYGPLPRSLPLSAQVA